MLELLHNLALFIFIKPYVIIKKLYNIEPAHRVLSFISCHTCTRTIDCFYLYQAFRVWPEFRKQGYGTILGLHVLNNILDKEKPAYLVAQPGPYEFDKTLTKEEQQKRTQNLIARYKKGGFEVTANRAIIHSLRALYALLRIPEDPTLFMIRKNEKS